MKQKTKDFWKGVWYIIVISLTIGFIFDLCSSPNRISDLEYKVEDLENQIEDLQEQNDNLQEQINVIDNYLDRFQGYWNTPNNLQELYK
jgi:chaperonin cofactor prefoldin